MVKYKQIKLNAKMLIKFCEKHSDKNKTSFVFDIQNKPVYEMVVQDTLLMEDCALFRQMAMSDILNFEKELLTAEKEAKTTIFNNLLHKIIIVDFKSIYDMKDSNKENSTKKLMLEKVKHLIENGFTLKDGDKETHFMPFDKSENMNRQSRITFIDISVFDKVNERLNIGIDFSKIKVTLSKYYAYRGLYLSTSKPVDLKLNEETLIVIPDINYEADHERYQKNTPKLSANGTTVTEDGKQRYEFFETIGTEKIKKPYDGQGFICPEYAGIINDQTGLYSANSFQIRLPFAKGMLHNVDFHEFLSEFDSKKYVSDKEYLIYDAFGRKRDLKKAKIIMTQSMFKCYGWVKNVVGNDIDPMQFYCQQVEKYGHKMFIANTDIPYGKSKTSRLSYQMINTLALDDDKFKTLTEQHLNFINEPIEYLKVCEDYISDGNSGEDLPNWKRALFFNPEFANCCYINQQLKNTQSSLMKQFASGRIVVNGQMRYLVRDLGFMLSRLIKGKTKADSAAAKIKIFDYRFFMPQGDENWYGFFRSPHLSRNEQCLLRALIPSKNSYTLKQWFYNADGVNETYRLLNKYFGHLTGIIMVGNESLVPMALGGADFDGDLVNIILDQTVTKAIKDGVYDEKYYRKIPYVSVPSNKSTETTVPKYISFESINNTFSNKIGLISDAAIGIGQFEYGNAESKNKADVATCAKCTILTGLEIDAAKHGYHPDLSMIEGKEYDCDFLKFSREFEKLSKHPRFYMNRLEVNTANDDEDMLELSIKNTDASILYPKNVKGTYINKLPHVFMDNLDYTLPAGGTKVLNDIFKIDAKTKKNSYFKELESRCKEYLNFYKNMIEIFEGDDVEKITLDAYYRQKNLDDLLTKLYDEKTVADIYENSLPLVHQNVSRFITTYEDLKKIRTELVEKNWHLTLDDKKSECLKTIFKSLEIEGADEAINGKEWDFLFVQRDGGYKLLWYIININAKKLILQSKLEELKTCVNKANLTEDVYKEQIIEEIEIYNEKIFDKDEQKGYHIPDFIVKAFYTSLSELIDIYQINIDDKVKLLFNLTKRQPKLRELFWNCFSWEELKSVISTNKNN